jgi:hypothetical protein
VETCRERAKECHRAAATANTEECKKNWLGFEIRWLTLAEKMELAAELVESFISLDRKRQ